jgi:hypothetical protein
MMERLRLRLYCPDSGPDSWHKLRGAGSAGGDDVAEEGACWQVGPSRTEVRIFYLAAGAESDPAAWMERVAEHGLGPQRETFGATFAEETSATGWPLTRIELLVRERGGGPQQASRVILCFQIFDTLAAALVHSEGTSWSAAERAEILRILDGAQPVQGDTELVALADLWR